MNPNQRPSNAPSAPHRNVATDHKATCNGPRAWLLAAAAILLSGCASMVPHGGIKHTGSIVEYLYPDANEAPQLQPAVVTLRPPVRVGVAFVPGTGRNIGLAEADKARLLARVKSAFEQSKGIGDVELIPTQYLRPKGGYANLEQVARMFNVDVLALLSYDQVQFNDTNSLAFLYWTIIGAYVVHGDQYDIQTMVDASVFDVKSRKLLLRAPGTSQIKGSASMASFSEQARAARIEGYQKAIDDLLPNLQTELDHFRERVKTDVAIRVETKPGSKGGGDVGVLGGGLALLLAGALFVSRSRAQRAHVPQL